MLMPVDVAAPDALTVAVKLAQVELPVWHIDSVLLPAAVPVKLSCVPLKFKVMALGLEMLEI